MKLVIATPSPFARKARVALLEKGIPFELLIDNPWNLGAQAPAHHLTLPCCASAGRTVVQEAGSRPRH